MLALLGGVRAAVFAGLAAVLGIYIFVLEIRLSECRQQASTAESNAATHKANAAGWQIDALEARVDLAACQRQWASAQQSLADQKRAAAELEAVKEAEIRAWKKRWESRPQSCKAALAALDTQCPGMEDY